jgi:ABC-type arginine transport system ATPase subunit
LNKAEADGRLEGIKVCANAPSINHLLFADDSLVLTKASSASAKTLQNILQLYEVCSGQTINFDKSSVMFSKNTSNGRIKEVLEELSISE